MNRRKVFILFAFIGFALAFAAGLPAARSAVPGKAALGTAEEFRVPLAWIAEALSGMPFLPASR